MVTNLYRLESVLSGIEGAQARVHVFPGETHTSVIGMNYVRGVMWAYGHPGMSFLQRHVLEQGAFEGNPDALEYLKALDAKKTQ